MASNLFAGNPPPNVVKWIDENVKSSGWKFDITKLGEPVASSYVVDTASTYAGNSRINMQQIQVIDDYTLQFGGPWQGQSYMWKFEDGHPFELNYLKSTYESRSAGIANYTTSWLTPDGTRLYYPIGTNPFVYYKTLSTPFDLTTAANQCEEYTQFRTDGGITWSSDGCHLIGRGSNEEKLYHLELAEPWNFNSTASLTSINTRDIGCLDWTRGFTFNKTGDQLVVAARSNAKNYLYHFRLTTPWDITTTDLVGTATLINNGMAADGSSGILEITALAINDSGTKLIIHNNQGSRSDAGYHKLFEYNLSK